METAYLFLLLLMGAVTYVPRWLPLVLLSRRKVPGWLDRWLDMIGPAILSALLLPSLLTSGEPRHIDFWNPGLFAVLPTFVFAWRTKSMGGSVVVGMLSYWLVGKLF
jgi:branched-subunit amino acid transport protein